MSFNLKLKIPALILTLLLLSELNSSAQDTLARRKDAPSQQHDTVHQDVPVHHGEAAAQIKDTSQHKMVIGHTKIEHIEKGGSHNWFSENYNSYIYDTASIEVLKRIPAGYHFIIVGGTWCTDTHREMPRFYKVIDDAAIPRDRVKVFFVDRDLQSPDMVGKKYKIKRIPTFIILDGEKEKGRIVEKPKASLEKDIVKIVK